MTATSSQILALAFLLFFVSGQSNAFLTMHSHQSLANLCLRNTISLRPKRNFIIARATGNGSGDDHDNDVSASELSTKVLLTELDKRQIRYPPTATRKELEKLLEGPTSPRNSTVASMIHELMERGVRLLPNASRADLEKLLREVKQQKRTSNQQEHQEPQQQLAPRRKQYKSIARLLKELDDLGIRYPPGASPSELERLLLQTRKSRQYSTSSTSSTSSRDNIANVSQNRKDVEKSLSITQMLKELNRRGIRFSPKASRQELEQLLVESQQNGKERGLGASPSLNTQEILSESPKGNPEKTMDEREYNTKRDDNKKEGHHRESVATNAKSDIDDTDNTEPGKKKKDGRHREAVASKAAIYVGSDNEATNNAEAVYSSKGGHHRESVTSKVRPGISDSGATDDAGSGNMDKERRPHRASFASRSVMTDKEAAPNRDFVAKKAQTVDGTEPFNQEKEEHERDSSASNTMSELNYDKETTEVSEPGNTLQEESLNDRREKKPSTAKVPRESAVDPEVTFRVDRYKSPSNNGRSTNNKRYSEQPGTHRPIPRRRRRRTFNRNRRSLWSSLRTEETAKKFTKRLSQVVERTARKARYAARRANNFFAEDENGIRDVDYAYVSKNPNVIIDVPAEPVVQRQDERKEWSRIKRRGARRPKPYQESTSPYERSRAPSSSTTRRQARRPSSPFSYSRTKNYRAGTAPPPPQDGSASVRNNTPTTSDDGRGASPPPLNAAAQSSLFRLPPPRQQRSSDKTTTRNSREKDSSSRSGNRRIYSPYDDSEAVYRDKLDRLGDFFVNAADTILWGRLGDDDYDNRPSGATASNGKVAQSAKRRRKKSDAASDGMETNWRDRLEERFDSMMGIHENGKYYNRWAVQEQREEQAAGGNDAFSVAQGRAPKRRRHRHGKARRRVYDKPFWEEEYMISNLFGRSPPDGYDNVGVGNLLPFFKTTFKSLLILATHACEWASVRGSVPQPVVVVGVTSCFLCARPSKRLLTTAASLVAFRIFGELIHEGLYGNEDWEDDVEEEEDDDVDDGYYYDGAQGYK